MRKGSSLILGVVLCVGMSGCTSNSKWKDLGKETPTPTETVEEAESTNPKDSAEEIQEPEEESPTEEAEEPQEIAEDPVVEEPEEAEEAAVKYPETFNVGDTITVPNQVDITYESAEFTDSIQPSNPEKECKDYVISDSSETYYDLVFNITNLGAEWEGADDFFEMMGNYDEQMIFGDAAIEMNEGASLDPAGITAIQPLVSAKVHFFIKVPKEAKDNAANLQMTMTLNNNDIQCKQDKSSNAYQIEGLDNSLEVDDSWESDTELKKGQTVTEDGNCELTLEKAEFTNKIEPPKPGIMYRVYENKDKTKTYAHVAISFKNLKAEDVNEDDIIEADLLYDSTYHYGGFGVLEKEDGSDFDFVEITAIPFNAARVSHYIFEVPVEMKDSGKPVAVIFKTETKSYYCKLGK